MLRTREWDPREPNVEDLIRVIKKTRRKHEAAPQGEFSSQVLQEVLIPEMQSLLAKQGFFDANISVKLEEFSPGSYGEASVEVCLEGMNAVILQKAMHCEVLLFPTAVTLR